MLIQLLTCKYREGCNFFDCVLRKKKLFTLEEIKLIVHNVHKPSLHCVRLDSVAVLVTHASLEIDGNVFSNDMDYIEGARVKLLPGNYLAKKNNPEIGSPWACLGTLSGKSLIGAHMYKVFWDNHTRNSYKLGDLILINNNCRSIWNN